MDKKEDDFSFVSIIYSSQYQKLKKKKENIIGFKAYVYCKLKSKFHPSKCNGSMEIAPMTGRRNSAEEKKIQLLSVTQNYDGYSHCDG